MRFTNKLLCLFLFLAELNTYISVITNTECYSLIASLMVGPKGFIDSSFECSKVFYFINSIFEGANGFVVAPIRDFSIHIFNNLFIFDFLFELNNFCNTGFIEISSISGLNFIRWVSYSQDIFDLERERDRENLKNKYRIS